MDMLSRREALGVALGGVVAAPARGDDEPGENLVLGPLAIDGWLLKTLKSSPLGGPQEPLSTPDNDDLAKALAKCRVYILDRKVVSKNKAMTFAKGYPRVLVGGQMCDKWKDGKTTFTVAVAKVATTDVQTTVTPGMESRRVGLLVTIHLWGTNAGDTAHSVYNFSSDGPAIAYDITGAVKPS